MTHTRYQNWLEVEMTTKFHHQMISFIPSLFKFAMTRKKSETFPPSYLFFFFSFYLNEWKNNFNCKFTFCFSFILFFCSNISFFFFYIGNSHKVLKIYFSLWNENFFFFSTNFIFYFCNNHWLLPFVFFFFNFILFL